MGITESNFKAPRKPITFQDVALYIQERLDYWDGVIDPLTTRGDLTGELKHIMGYMGHDPNGERWKTILKERKES